MSAKLQSRRAAALPLTAIAMLALAVPRPVLAADVAKEIQTAEAHAGYAVGAADMKTVQMHLHHVVNCMVGPKGKGFDASQADPCKDMGNGVMPDFKGSKAKRGMLQHALDDARAGLQTTDIAAAKQKATDAQGLLKKAM